MGTSKNRRLIRIEVSHEMFASLETLALAAGTPLATYCRAVLVDRIADDIHNGGVLAPASPSRESVTSNEWRHLLAWVRADVTRIRAYPGPKASLNAEQRVTLYNWALDNGMPDPHGGP